MAITLRYVPIQKLTLLKNKLTLCKMWHLSRLKLILFLWAIKLIYLSENIYKTTVFRHKETAALTVSGMLSCGWPSGLWRFWSWPGFFCWELRTGGLCCWVWPVTSIGCPFAGKRGPGEIPYKWKVCYYYNSHLNGTSINVTPATALHPAVIERSVH